LDSQLHTREQQHCSSTTSVQIGTQYAAIIDEIEVYLFQIDEGKKHNRIWIRIGKTAACSARRYRTRAQLRKIAIAHTSSSEYSSKNAMHDLIRML